MGKKEIIQFTKTDNFELFVTGNGEVYQRNIYYKSTGGMYKIKKWDRWYKRDLEKELKENEQKPKI